MAFTVFYTVQISDVATKIFEAAGGKTVVTNHFFDEAGYIEELKELKPEAIMCRTEPITAAMMDAAGPNLKVIGKQGAGLDNIDVEAATARKIRVVYAPGQNAQSVAEQSVFLMLACARRFNYVDRQFRSGNYKVRFGLEHTYELQGKTLGLVGCGRIGRMLAGIAKNGFGMNVIAYDPYPDRDFAEAHQTRLVSLDELYAESDIISLHCPLTDENKFLINRDSIQKMKPGMMLINTGRGPLLDEQAVANALNNRSLFAVGVDVLSTEPPMPTNPLLKATHCYITPHIAWATREARIRLIDIATRNLKAFQEGNSINEVSL